MAIYVFMNLGTFAVILCMRRNGQMVETIEDLAGLSKTRPALALALGIFMFSMAGIPPLAGFISKLYVFMAAIDAGLYTLAVIGVVTSVVGAFYYLRIVKLMYFDEPTGAFDQPIGIEMRGVLIYMAIYVFMNLGTFAVILCMRRDGQMVEAIEDLAGLSKTRPALALALGIFMFSMAGIPPLAGFFSKLYVFLAAIDAGLYPLAVIGVVTSVVGAYYYVRIVKLMYFDEPTGIFDQPIGGEMRTVLIVTAAFILFFFVMPGPLLTSAEVAAAALFAG